MILMMMVILLMGEFCGAVDCNDGNSGIHPGIAENCNTPMMIIVTLLPSENPPCEPVTRQRI